MRPVRPLLPATLFSLIFLAWCFPAGAQTPVPGAALPGQIERQFQEAPKARSLAAPLTAPLKPQPVPAGAEEIRLRLHSIEVDGLTVYSSEELHDYLTPLLQREISLADLYRLADRLTARYRNDGYLLSQVIVPEQKVTNGIARLQAVEGFIGAVRLVGVDYDRRALVAAHAERIRASRPLAAEVLEREMLLINDLPGAFARAVLSPSAETFGAADLTILFSQRRIPGGISANNRGGRAMGPMRYLTDLEGVNLLGLHDRTQARYIASPSKELQYLSILHEQPVSHAGGKIIFSANRVRAVPEEMAFIPLNLETKSTSLSVTYTHPVLRARSENLQLRATLAGHNGEVSLFGITDTEDRLRVVRFGLGYDLADTWNGISLFDLEYSQGLRGLGASDNGALLLSRPAGKVDFGKVNLYAARLQSLTPRWSLLAAFSGQYAFDNLLVSELYSFGGEIFGRGYDPSELVGDHGAALKLELRYADRFDPGIAIPYTLYGFYDAGRVWQRPVDGQSSNESATALGLGVRFSLGAHLSGFLEFAKPLTRDVAAEGNRHGRFFAGLSARF